MNEGEDVVARALRQVREELAGLRADGARTREEVRALRQALAGPAAARRPPPGGEELVTLDQIAAIVQRRKRGLERYKKTMPRPRDPGGHGRAALWAWAEVRPWLERTFGRTFPESFPGLAAG